MLDVFERGEDELITTSWRRALKLGRRRVGAGGGALATTHSKGWRNSAHSSTTIKGVTETTKTQRRQRKEKDAFRFNYEHDLKDAMLPFDADKYGGVVVDGEECDDATDEAFAKALDESLDPGTNKVFEAFGSKCVAARVTYPSSSREALSFTTRRRSTSC